MENNRNRQRNQKEQKDMEPKDVKDMEQKDTRIYLHMDNDTDDEGQIDLLNIAGHMAKRKKLYKYILAVAVCLGVLAGLVYEGVTYVTGKSSYARAVISFQYEGIEDGLDPNGSAFDINKLKSPAVIEEALVSLGITDIDAEDVRANIEIEGVIPEDAVERITVIKEMALEDVSNYEKILDVSYYPSQYIVYLYNDFGMSGSETVQILNAVLESYREYFLDTYANTEVLTVAANLIDYTDYDYVEAVDMLETQIEIMQNYVEERRNQASEFRSAATGLSFGDIVTALGTVEDVDLANLDAYIEGHTLTKDKERLIEYYEYNIKKYNMAITEYQVQLSNIQSTIDKYQKDPMVIVSSQETTQQLEVTNEYYDELQQQKLDVAARIAALNTDLNETYTLLKAVKNTNVNNTQDEYDYADEKLASVAQTVAQWADLTEETTDEYYPTTLFSNAYKIGVPAQYSAAGGMMSIIKNIAICVAGMVFVVLIIWCIDGLSREIRQMRKNKAEK
ncbi:MAG: hypothetical protein LUE96_09600 [Lachnospiraceae bacterium]|nr:hypothetical protein [Lachnospiraceae bacterium]